MSAPPARSGATSFPRKPAASRPSWEARAAVARPLGLEAETLARGGPLPRPAASGGGWPGGKGGAVGLDAWPRRPSFPDGQGPGRWAGLLAGWHHGHRPPGPGPPPVASFPCCLWLGKGSPRWSHLPGSGGTNGSLETHLGLTDEICRHSPHHPNRPSMGFLVWRERHLVVAGWSFNSWYLGC